MKFRIVSYRRGNIMDIGEAINADGIKKFTDERPNADSFKAYPHNDLNVFLTGYRVTSKDPVHWQKRSKI